MNAMNRYKKARRSIKKRMNPDIFLHALAGEHATGVIKVGGRIMTRRQLNGMMYDYLHKIKKHGKETFYNRFVNQNMAKHIADAREKTKIL